ncbi:MAG: fibrillarin-like rRNA/tRNA 2'-O-methyltransferase [Nanoarchaeota archaeon]|nr:fibrillarin-like rRNA/tRNA 2'-O-methyltransferase [Nanoarchaeota archaeon]
MNKTNYAHVFKQGSEFYTKSLVKDQSVYGEKVIDGYYREWVPDRSKLGAAMHKNLRIFPFKKDSIVLYLGASSGTTCSHISDVVTEGVIFAVDLAPRIFYKFVELSKSRENLMPVLADALHPEAYAYVPQVDVVFQDIAQRDQLSIFFKNVDLFLKKGGTGMLAVKSRSVDVTKNPKEVFKTVRTALKNRYELLDERGLQPFEKDHMLFVIRKK